MVGLGEMVLAELAAVRLIPMALLAVVAVVEIPHHYLMAAMADQIRLLMQLMDAAAAAAAALQLELAAMAERSAAAAVAEMQALAAAQERVPTA